MRITLLFILVSFLAHAQSSYVPLNEDYYHWVDRYEIKSGKIIPQIFTVIKPYKRSAIISMIDTAKTYGVIESRADQFNYDYLMNDSWEWSAAQTSESKKPVLRH